MFYHVICLRLGWKCNLFGIIFVVRFIIVFLLSCKVIPYPWTNILCWLWTTASIYLLTLSFIYRIWSLNFIGGSIRIIINNTHWVISPMWMLTRRHLYDTQCYKQINQIREPLAQAWQRKKKTKYKHN